LVGILPDSRLWARVRFNRGAVSDEIQQYEAALDEAAERIARLELEVGAVTERGDDLQSELNEARARIQRLQGDMAEAADELDTWQKRAREAEIELRKVLRDGDAEALVADLTDQRDAIRAKLTEVEAELELARNPKAKAAPAELAELEAALEQASDHITMLEEGRTEAVVIDRLREQLEEVQDDRDRLADELRREVDERAELEGRIAALEAARTLGMPPEPPDRSEPVVVRRREAPPRPRTARERERIRRHEASPRRRSAAAGWSERTLGMVLLIAGVVAIVVILLFQLVTG
jgi:chromosome segregation ATPase